MLYRYRHAYRENENSQEQTIIHRASVELCRLKVYLSLNLISYSFEIQVKWKAWI